MTDTARARARSRLRSHAAATRAGMTPQSTPSILKLTHNHPLRTPREAELAQLGFAQRQIRRGEKLKFRRRYPIDGLPLLASECMDASGFLPSVEMTDVGGVHEYHSFSQAPRSSFRALGEESRGVHAPNLATCAVPLRSGFLAAATRGNDTSASRAGDIQSGLPPVRRFLRRASKQRCGGTTPRVFESLPR